MGENMRRVGGGTLNRALQYNKLILLHCAAPHQRDQSQFKMWPFKRRKATKPAPAPSEDDEDEDITIIKIESGAMNPAFGNPMMNSGNSTMKQRRPSKVSFTSGVELKEDVDNPSSSSYASKAPPPLNTSQYQSSIAPGLSSRRRSPVPRGGAANGSARKSVFFRVGDFVLFSLQRDDWPVVTPSQPSRGMSMAVMSSMSMGKF